VKKTTEIDIIISSNLCRLIGDEYGNQIRIARAIGILPGSLNRILKCKAHAGPKVVADIAKALGVPEIDIYQVYKPPVVPAPDTVSDAGKHIIKLLNRIDELEEKLAQYDSFKNVPYEVLAYLSKIDWSAKGVFRQMKLAMRPFLIDASLESQSDTGT
jgi:hypothetical protein